MAQSMVYNIRLERRIHDDAAELFKSMGLTLSAAISLFLTQTIAQEKLPLAEIIPIPNALTRQAMLEAERIINEPGREYFTNAHDLIVDILAEEDDGGNV